MYHILISPKDSALLNDIELLNHSLQYVMREQVSIQTMEVFKTLLRKDLQQEQLEQCIANLSLQQMQELIRSCSLYAQVFNIAEDLHHERRRNAYEAQNTVPRNGSVEHLCNKYKKTNSLLNNCNMHSIIPISALLLRPTRQKSSVRQF